MTYLADVNFWLALAVDNHVHHATAAEWIRNYPEDYLAFCRMTQNGLLRLLTNPHVMGSDVLTAARAWEAYDTLCENRSVLFADEPVGVERTWRSHTRHSRKVPNFWTDAYLAAFTTAAGFTLVTFDHALAKQAAPHAYLLVAPR
jgi:toxin-antitoxin system PIN domain toxin